MSIEIINPTPDLEKTILTFIPVTHRFKTDRGYAIESYHATMDPFSDRVDIFIKTAHIKLDLNYRDREDCDSTVIHKGGIA